MRASPCGWAGRDEADVLDLAARSAAITHDHPEGIKGARALALAIYLARNGADAEALLGEIESRFGYDLSQSPAEIRPGHGFDVSAAGTLPVALSCVLHASDFEETIRNAVWLGGDTDTIACIAGAVAEAMYGLPDEIRQEARQRLDAPLRTAADRFEEIYMTGGRD
jgi:ADP-ribosylglycohydrolase